MAKPLTTAQLVQLEIPASRALFEGAADAWIVGLSSVERPPRGLAGLLDWQLKGWISKSLQSGIFSGTAGECSYLPVTTSSNSGNRTIHLLLVGLGSALRPPRGKSERNKPLPATTLESLEQNLKTLGRKCWGVSTSDLGEDSIKQIGKTLGSQFQEATLWISP